VPLAEFLSRSILKSVTVKGLNETLAGGEVQHGTDETTLFAEVSTGVEVGKEARNSIGGKDVVDPPRTAAVE
jgi:K+-transporting ATPase A subunit